MADQKKHDDLQNYIDILEKYGKDEGDNENIEEPTPPPYKKNDDIISKPAKKNNAFHRLSDWFNNLPKKKKIIVSVVAIILAIIIILGTVFGIFVANKFDLMGDNINSGDEDIIYEDGDFGDINIDIGSAGFKQALQDWATMGNENRMSSKNVINVLLVGADSRKGENEGNTDVMMLVSLNRKTKQLKMVSFLRDSYLYIQGKNNSYCSKLNAAFSMGGPQTLMETIENNYKIDIDSYVMVNFESFKAIVDAMGGVTVDVKQYEADYNYSHFGVELPAGENVTLNGRQALCFCRIRGCDPDGDVSRTRRQRQVIDAIIDKVKSASLKDLNKYIDVFLPYVDTGYSKSQILSLGIKAITGQWYNYERTQLQAPDEECRTSGSANAWIWVVDYQLAAHKLQTELYGQSNIILDENRTSIIDIYRGANYSGNTSSPVTPTVNTDTPNPTENNNRTTEASTEKQDIPQTSEPIITTEEDTQQNETTTEAPSTEPIETIPETTLPPETTLSQTEPTETQAVVEQ